MSLRLKGERRPGARRMTKVIALAAMTMGCRDVVAVPANPPENLTATLAAPTTVQLSWTARPAPERVSSYAVYRNGELVGETDNTAYTDSGMLESFVLSYTVAARTSSGEESMQSEAVSVTTGDGTSPRVAHTFVEDGTPPFYRRNTAILVVFSEGMDSASINASTLTVKLTSTGEPIPGTVSYFKRNQYAEFRPASPFADLASVTIGTSAAMRDLAGNPLAAPYSVVVTTYETVFPRVISSEPADGARDVPLTQTIRVTFSEEMDETSLLGVYLTSGAIVATTRSYDRSTNVLTLTPLAPLGANKTHFIIIPSTVKDLSGNPINPFIMIPFITRAL